MTDISSFADTRQIQAAISALSAYEQQVSRAAIGVGKLKTSSESASKSVGSASGPLKTWVSNAGGAARAGDRLSNSLLSIARDGRQSGNYIGVLIQKLPSLVSMFGSMPLTIAATGLALAHEFIPGLQTSAERAKELENALGKLSSAASRYSDIDLSSVNFTEQDSKILFERAKAYNEIAIAQRNAAKFDADTAIEEILPNVSSSFEKIDGLSPDRLNELIQINKRRNEAVEFVRNEEANGLDLRDQLTGNEIAERAKKLKEARDLTLSLYNSSSAMDDIRTAFPDLDDLGLQQIVSALHELNNVNSLSDKSRELREFGAALHTAFGGEQGLKDAGHYDLYKQVLQASNETLIFEFDDAATEEEKAIARTNLLATYQEELKLRQIIAAYGKDSAEVASFERAQYQESVRKRFEQLGISKELVETMTTVVMTTYDAAIGAEEFAAGLKAGADEAEQIAQRVAAAQGAMNALLSQGASQRFDRHLQMKYADDPVGLAGARKTLEVGRGVVDIARSGAGISRIWDSMKDGFGEVGQTIRSEMDWQEFLDSRSSSGGGGAITSQLEQQAQEWRSRISDLETEAERYQRVKTELELMLAGGMLNPEEFAIANQLADEDYNKKRFQPLVDGIKSVSEAMAQAIVNGEDMGDAVTNALRAIAAEIIATQITNSLLQIADFLIPGLGIGSSGGVGGLKLFEGGGYTGNAARAGGVDGKGGFLAVLHPQETVVDHYKGQGLFDLGVQGGFMQSISPGMAANDNAMVGRGGGGQVDVAVKVSVEDRSRNAGNQRVESRKGPNGNIELVIVDAVKNAMGDGRLDKMMGKRFGVRPQAQGA
jgi:hypothetical protein